MKPIFVLFKQFVEDELEFIGYTHDQDVAKRWLRKNTAAGDYEELSLYEEKNE